MRIAVMADVHGNLPALEAVATHIRAERFDAVVNLGDTISGPLFPRETAQFLMAQDWTQIAGNHERQLLAIGPRSIPSDVYAHSQISPQELAWIAALPATRVLDGDILLCHGTPSSDVTPLLEDGDRLATQAQIAARLGSTDAALILCAHSHVPRSVRHGRTLIVNPGSVGLQAYDEDRPFRHVIQTGSPDARYAVVERRAGGWSASLVSVPYAADRAAAAASANGRADWAAALRTGYVAATEDRPDNAMLFVIRQDDLSGRDTRALLALHLDQMHANSPAGSVHALGLSGLDHPAVTVWTAWHDDGIAGVGALKILRDDHAEVKSMRTAPGFLRRGAASAILETIIAAAKARGVRRLSLETGSGPAFEPALALYRRRGFADGAAFGDYRASAFNQFLHLDMAG